MAQVRQKPKRAKNNGGGFPALQPPGNPQGIHVKGRPDDFPCRCGLCLPASRLA